MSQPDFQKFDAVVHLAIAHTDKVPVSKMLVQFWNGHNLVVRISAREAIITNNIVDVACYIEDMLPGMIRALGVNPVVHATITNKAEV